VTRDNEHPIDDFVRRAVGVDEIEVASVWSASVAKQALLQEITSMSPTTTREPQTNTRPTLRRGWLRRLPALAGVAAVIAAALLVGPALLLTPDAPSPAELMLSYESTDRSLSDVLLQAAAAAGSAPAEDAQATTWRVETWAMTGGNAPAQMRPEVRQWWRTPDGLYYRAQSGDPLEVGDELRDLPDDVDGELVSAADPYGELAARLPSDPQEAADFLAARATNPDIPDDVEVFESVRGLLDSHALSGEQRAALYEVLARLESTELVGETVDRAGRTGTAIGVVSDHSGATIRYELIIDPAWGKVLAFQEILLEPMVAYPNMQTPAVVEYMTYF
jgi:hypothetical protein